MDQHIFSKKPLGDGQKIARVRMCKGIKQEYLAKKLGVSQPQVSKIEEQEKVEEELLKQIADILDVPVDSIKNFSDERITYYINGPYLGDVKIEFSGNESKDSANGNFVAQQFNFNGDSHSHEVIKELVNRLVQSEQELTILKNGNDNKL
jgi:transcriptional regulator with XRE-family HTH domain